LEYSEKSDVWSYGALLVELITGGEPFPGLDLMNVATEVRDGRATALSFVSQDNTAPSWILELIQLCFTFHEKERPSFNEVVAFLTENAPIDFQVDPNEESPDEASMLDTVKGRKRGRSRKASSAKPGTKYADLHNGASSTEMTTLKDN
jgi:serine/threonine protein kinase